MLLTQPMSCTMMVVAPVALSDVVPNRSLPGCHMVNALPPSGAPTGSPAGPAGTRRPSAFHWYAVACAGAGGTSAAPDSRFHRSNGANCDELVSSQIAVRDGSVTPKRC